MAQDNTAIEEDLELTAVTGGAAPIQLPGKVTSIFPALAHRNFQLYFAGQAISLIGFWLQAVGQGWLIFQLTHSAFWVGAVATAQGLPALVLTTFAGVIIDKLNKQKILVVAQILEAIVALSLGALIISGRINVPIILAASVISGIISSIELPTRLAFAIEMVGKKDLASATSLNSGIFNAARFVGPALAGALIALWGVGWTFVLNGLSFLPAVLAIWAVRPVHTYKAEVDIHPIDSLKNGLKYSFSHPTIFSLLIIALISAIFIWPYQTLMPVLAQNVFQKDASGLGSLLSAAGAGSLLGAIFVSWQSKRANKIPFVTGGILISTISLIAFSMNKNFLLAHILLSIVGFGLLIQISILSTIIQLLSPDQMRGRIMAVYLTMFVGMMPIGNILAGALAEKTSAQLTIAVGAAIALAVAAIMYFKGTFQNLSAQ